VKQRVQDLIQEGDNLFSKRSGLMSLWQETALQFYPIRADFTSSHTDGEEYAAHLMTGRPALAHRELSNAVSSMLRPKDTPWFHARTEDESINSDARAKQYLDQKAEIMRRVMYDRRAQFVSTTKQGDNDFIAFGQCVISIEPNRYLDGLLFRPWHLRDVAWCENAEREIDVVHRKSDFEARTLMRLFPKTVHKNVEKLAKKEPYKEVKCRHIVVPAEQYDYGADQEGKKVNRERFPFVSITVDVENQCILEEVPRKRLGYIIPRWVRPSNSQYAHSLATYIALPDARLLQRITLTLLEAGEKAVDPPLKATKEAITGAVNTFAGGITWVDEEYDEKMGKALEALMDPPNLNFGIDREQRISEMIAEAFYLNKITLPDLSDGKMTAFEVQKRMEEFIRGALPLFEPMEVEYNGALCEETFESCMDLGIFGPMDDIPPILSERKLRWQFESPLQAATERAKSQAFVQSMNLLKIAMEVDPGAVHDFNVSKGLRAALLGSGSPADWIPSEEEAAAGRESDQQAAMLRQAAEAGAIGGDVAGKVGQGIQSLQAAAAGPA
jgi:hypothetical protein